MMKLSPNQIISLFLLCFLTVHAQPFVNNETNPSLASKHILVIAALADDPALIMAEESLNGASKSYKTLIATRETLSDKLLYDASGKGLFSAIILTEGNLAYHDGSGWRSAFDQEEWEKLWSYQKTFGVKQVSLYTYPGASPEDYGLRLVQPIDTTLRPQPVMLTEQGKEILKPELEQFNVTGAYGYLSRLEPVAGVSNTPLIVDEKGNILAVYSSFEGRERIALTMSQNRDAEHSKLLFNALINWLSLPLSNISSTSPEAVNNQPLTLEYFILLAGLITLALLLANWLFQRQKAKRRMAHKNSFYNY